MTTYRIARWRESFENSRTERIKHKGLSYIMLPTKHDGKGYRRMAKHDQCERLLSAWVLSVQVAAKCPERGVLADEDGPLSPEDMHDKTGYPAATFAEGWPELVKIGWMEVDGGARTGMASGNSAASGKRTSSPAKSGQKKPVGADAKRARRPATTKESKPYTETQKPGSGGYVWGAWVEVNRARGNPDPVPVGADIKAAGEIGKVLPAEETEPVLAAYLDDTDGFVVKQGHALRLLPGRLGAYRNKQDSGVPEPSDEAVAEMEKLVKRMQEGGK